MGIPESTLEKLRAIRQRTDVTIRPTPLLRTTLVQKDGTEKPFALRYYQVQMVLHLVSMPRFIVGDDMGLGKTAESIAGLCYLWEKDPTLRVLVLTKKSAVRQWAEEFKRFTSGVDVVVCKGTPKQRAAAIETYLASKGPSALIMGHRGAVQDFRLIQDVKWGVLVVDEVTVVKSPTTQMHQICRHLSLQSQRVWGLTGTLIKNNLLEGYGIYRVVEPNVFALTLNAFIDNYCITELVNVGRGRKIKQVVGYRKASIEIFRNKIEPYYLGRPKHLVAAELPPLTTRRVRVPMSEAQSAKYKEALTGLLEIGTGDVKEVTKLTAVTYCQEIVDHPELIGIQGDSGKLDALLDILTDGDLEGEKVIIFTRFEKMVTLGVAALEKAGIQCVRITGKEGEDERAQAQATFQDTSSGVPVVWITTAGSDAINLQAAKAIIFYDTPFSAGDLLQCLGRMIRIGSTHDKVFALHLVAEDSVDERVMDIIDGKMELLEAIIGKRIKGESDGLILSEAGTIDALFESLRETARGLIRA